MRCPFWIELPNPPGAKTGWPWTEESPQLSETMSDGSPWPRISIVTPSYNQGQFIEETIRSVLLQGYPNLEYIIIDGGSTDRSVEIIKKYEPWLSYWVSERDDGQADAINTGLKLASGEIVAWLNSDDVYTPGSIAQAVTYLVANPSVPVVFGDSTYIDADGKKVGSYHTAPFDLADFLFYCAIPQPSSFLRKWVIQEVKYLDASLHFIMDHDLWIRIGLHHPIHYFPQRWSSYRRHAASKSTTREIVRWEETIDLLKRLFSESESSLGISHIKERVFGNAYWNISLAYLQAGDLERTSGYLKRAIKDYPDWPLNQLSQNIIITYAMSAKSPVQWIQYFFSLVQQPILNRVLAQNKVISSYYAKMSLSGEISRVKAGEYAWRAIQRDPRWLANRNVMNRFLAALIGEDAVNTLRKYI